MVLEKENAIADLRELMGATNPANADEGTLRKKFAGSIQRMPSTARMRRRPPPLKSAIGLPDMNWFSAVLLQMDGRTMKAA